MNITTLTESKEAAKKKYAEYLDAVNRRHMKEYVTLKKAYRELSKGRSVIDIVDVMRTAGFDQLWRPKLAIIRADAKLCYFNWRWGSEPRFSAVRGSNRQKLSDVVGLPESTFSVRPPEPHRYTESRAVVPTIPPRLLPDGPLNKYHILWEAEWERMPVDPILLRHIGKNLYTVLAQWDLTPLERAVLQPMPSN